MADQFSQWERAGHIAHFLESSAARLGRLIKNARVPLLVIRNEIRVLQRRVADLEAALPWTDAEVAELDRQLDRWTGEPGVQGSPVVLAPDTMMAQTDTAGVTVGVPPVPDEAQQGDKQ